jgi:methylated-DNA-protein-cysteine methyltransferase-like protein
MTGSIIILEALTWKAALKGDKMARVTSPPDPIIFKNKVWEVVRQIPAGQVATYGQIAAMIPAPGGMDAHDYLAFGARWVGSAMASCPSDVPWQRVINAQGKISLPPGAGYEHQRQLLEQEGIEFDQLGRIDLTRFRWSGQQEA